MLFATLNLERDPLKLADVGRGLAGWVQDVGGFAAFALLVWLLIRLVGPRRFKDSRWGFLAVWEEPRGRAAAYDPVPRWASSLFSLCALGAILGYLATAALRLPGAMAPAPAEGEEVAAGGLDRFAGTTLTFAAACAIVAVCLPFVVNLLQLRWRRVWSIARLSFKEAVRRKVLYVFSALLLVFLFLNWFVPAKPESQLRSYVTVVFWALTPLMLVPAALIAAFGIPTDIKSQTIHTVVTKPVERFEIVLGRFLGYTLLMTGVLFLLTTLSLAYVFRGINPDAAAESLKARVPLYADRDMTFPKIKGEHTDQEEVVGATAENVGREWAYHKYIAGSAPDRTDTPIHYAVWSYDDVPGSLATRDRVRCEFKFDIYRTHKGKENEGILCSFFFQTRYFNKAGPDRKQYLERYAGVAQGTDTTLAEENALAEEFGYYEVQGKVIADYHTLHVDVPAGLFKNALSGPPGGSKEPVAGAPLVTVRVRCESPGQFIGMARYDLYFRLDGAGAGADRLAFAVNFYKGALGLWMVMCLVIGLSVFLSTELSGVITFLCVMFLYLFGWAREFVQGLANKEEVGGGPLESFFRLVGRKNLVSPLEETTLTAVATQSDEVFRWFIRRFLNVLPDVERFSFSDRVANGFDVGLVTQDLLPTMLLLAGYLLPWALLAFYLIKSREIAGAT